MRKIAALEKVTDKDVDPREALLKYAKAAAENPYWVAPAYNRYGGILPLKFNTSTINCEYFDVKIFSDSMACAKIKHIKDILNINDSAVQGCLSENCLTRKIIA